MTFTAAFDVDSAKVNQLVKMYMKGNSLQKLLTGHADMHTRSIALPGS